MLHFLKNIWRYRRELWNDHNWDGESIIPFIERKLKLLHEELSGPRAIAIHTQQEFRRLKTAIEYARRINNPDQYMDRMPDRPKGKRCFEADTPEDVKAMMPIVKAISDLEKRDWDGLWDTLKKYTKTWWD